MFNKKAQISPSIALGIIGAVISILFIGIVISTSQQSLTKLRDVATNEVATLRLNETPSFANNTAILAGSCPLGIVPGTEIVWGHQGGTMIQLGSGNYTMNYTRCQIYPQNITTYDWYNGTSFNWTYQYFTGSQDRNLTIQNQNGVKNISDFQPTFGTIIAISIVMMLLIPTIIFLFNKFA